MYCKREVGEKGWLSVGGGGGTFPLCSYCICSCSGIGFLG
jgi:hypothetical protein